jgi:hypothetical protein
MPRPTPGEKVQTLLVPSLAFDNSLRAHFVSGKMWAGWGATPKVCFVLPPLKLPLGTVTRCAR